MAALLLNSLPLGFRFSPTDEELINYYLWLWLKINRNEKEVLVNHEIDVIEVPEWILIELGNDCWAVEGHWEGLENQVQSDLLTFITLKSVLVWWYLLRTMDRVVGQTLRWSIHCFKVLCSLKRLLTKRLLCKTFYTTGDHELKAVAIEERNEDASEKHAVASGHGAADATRLLLFITQTRHLLFCSG
nr:nac domain-containing protein 91 [Quercus suber]